MNDFQQIQKLIRLKRFEVPPEDFVEDFLAKFRERQRSELLRQSARGLLFERFEAYFHDLLMPKWTMAAATAAVALLAGWGTLQVIGNQSPNVAQFSFPAPDLPRAGLLATAERAPDLDVESELIKKVTSPEQVEIESMILLSRHFENGTRMEVYQGPGVSADLMPAYDEFVPVADFPR